MAAISPRQSPAAFVALRSRVMNGLASRAVGCTASSCSLRSRIAFGRKFYPCFMETLQEKGVPSPPVALAVGQSAGSYIVVQLQDFRG